MRGVGGGSHHSFLSMERRGWGEGFAVFILFSGMNIVPGSWKNLEEVLHALDEMC